MICATNLKMRFGAKVLFKNANIQLNPGQHYGLVGANGTGKSTLIKILMNEVTPEAGDVTIPSQIKVGALSQNHFAFENVPILNVVLMGKKELWEAFQAKNALLMKNNFSDAECEQLEKFEKIIERYSGYSAESEAATLLEGLGVAAPLHQCPLSVLSGGFKLRVLLAQLLFSQPDVMLLDEPTNHLDIYSIRWLENYLKDFAGTLLISSHDRHFLNATCQHIVDIDYQAIKLYKGNYEEFLVAKQAEREQKLAVLANQEKKRDDLQEFITRFGAKATKATQAQSRAKQIEKIEEEMASIDISASSRLYPKVNFQQHRPSGVIALTVKELDKAYGSKEVLKKISFQVERGDRIAILGANGIGKTTLLEIITQYASSDRGSVEFGHAAQFAYFPQDHKREVNAELSLLDWLRQVSPQTPDEKLRATLGLVLFSGDDVHKQIKILSGGETARLILAKMMLINHNFLLFDEPTNHLDMESTDSLIEALQNYPGTILFVSHSRHFISQVSTRIIEITNKGLRDFRCTYPEYLEKTDTDLLNASLKQKQKNTSNEARSTYEDQKTQRNLKSQLERNIAAVEKNCHTLETELSKLNKIFESEEFYHSPAAHQIELAKQKEALEQKLETAMNEWETLSESLLKQFPVLNA
jgi:ATPase subunit of ABC transporter with duplicated ATPase domains